MDAHGLARHPTQSPVGAHGIPRGRPWVSMAGHVGFRGRPPKVPWDSSETTVQLIMGPHVGPHAWRDFTLCLTTFGPHDRKKEWRGMPRGIPRGVPRCVPRGIPRGIPRGTPRDIPRGNAM